MNAARPESWKVKVVDESLLQKNLRNFILRNERLYQDIRKDVGAYVAACAQLPAKERPTLARWTLDRRTGSSKPY